MKRFIITVVLLITCFVLQGTMFRFLAFGEIVPNLMIIITVAIGLMRGEKSGMLVGFFSGLLMDIFSGSVIGFNTLVLMYIGYGNGKLSKVFFPEDVKLPMAMIIASDLTYGFLSYALLFLLRGRLNISYYFLHIMLPECVYTILITVLLYPLILLMNRLLERSEKRSAKKFV